jgi:hypothetical protein
MWQLTQKETSVCSPDRFRQVPTVQARKSRGMTLRVTKHNVMKNDLGRGGNAPHILNLGSRKLVWQLQAVAVLPLFLRAGLDTAVTIPDSLGFRCQKWFLFTVFVCQHMETEQTIPEPRNEITRS